MRSRDKEESIAIIVIINLFSFVFTPECFNWTFYGFIMHLTTSVTWNALSTVFCIIIHIVVVKKMHFSFPVETYWESLDPTLRIGVVFFGLVAFCLHFAFRVCCVGLVTFYSLDKIRKLTQRRVLMNCNRDESTNIPTQQNGEEKESSFSPEVRVMNVGAGNEKRVPSSSSPLNKKRSTIMSSRLPGNRRNSSGSNETRIERTFHQINVNKRHALSHNYNGEPSFPEKCSLHNVSNSFEEKFSKNAEASRKRKVRSVESGNDVHKTFKEQPNLKKAGVIPTSSTFVESGAEAWQQVYGGLLTLVGLDSKPSAEMTTYQSGESNSSPMSLKRKRENFHDVEIKGPKEIKTIQVGAKKNGANDVGKLETETAENAVEYIEACIKEKRTALSDNKRAKPCVIKSEDENKVNNHNRLKPEYPSNFPTKFEQDILKRKHERSLELTPAIEGSYPAKKFARPSLQRRSASMSKAEELPNGEESRNDPLYMRILNDKKDKLEKIEEKLKDAANKMSERKSDISNSSHVGAAKSSFAAPTTADKTSEFDSSLSSAPLNTETTTLTNKSLSSGPSGFSFGSTSVVTSSLSSSSSTAPPATNKTSAAESQASAAPSFSFSQKSDAIKIKSPESSLLPPLNIKKKPPPSPSTPVDRKSLGDKEGMGKSVGIAFGGGHGKNTASEASAPDRIQPLSADNSIQQQPAFVFGSSTKQSESSNLSTPSTSFSFGSSQLSEPQHNAANIGSKKSLGVFGSTAQQSGFDKSTSSSASFSFGSTQSSAPQNFSSAQQFGGSGNQSNSFNAPSFSFGGPVSTGNTSNSNQHVNFAFGESKSASSNSFSFGSGTNSGMTNTSSGGFGSAPSDGSTNQAALGLGRGLGAKKKTGTNKSRLRVKK